MSRTSNTLIRQQQIIEGMMTALSQVGYEGATMPIIAEAANLTPGLIHYHFQSKQAILVALVEHLSNIVDTRFQHLLRDGTGKARLEAFVQAHVGLGQGADARAVACWISIGAESVRQPEVRSAYQRVTLKQLTTLEEICSRALREAGRSTKRKREIALGIICAIEGAYRLLVSAPESIVPGFAARTITNMATGLIAAQPVLSRA